MTKHVQKQLVPLNFKKVSKVIYGKKILLTISFVVFVWAWLGQIPAKAQLATDSATIKQESSPAEKTYWADQAALLDPRAYEFVTGKDWSRTVPEGEVWYALSLYQTDAGGTKFFLRIPDARNPILLPAGTVLKNTPNQTAYAYYCRPSKVINTDSRYTTDPKGLYYERLNRLRTLKQFALAAYIPASPIEGVVFAKFPTNFTYGLITSASAYDIAWTGIANINAKGETTGVLNLLNEISNYHQIRFAQPVFIPFTVSTFPKLAAKAANVSGDRRTVTSINGNGAVLYFKLPDNW